MQAGYEIHVLYEEAQSRWLKPKEVLFVLQNHEKFGLTLEPEPPQKPPSGSLFLFNKRVVRFFRKDGHNWRKKKDGRTVGEAHERVKVGKTEALNCYYAHGEQNPNFQRRSYWMLDPLYEHIVLVHYRDVSLSKVDLEWIFVITNFVLEIPSAVFDQLSSVRKTQYALLSMLMSFAALLICIVELIYTCQKKKVEWRWISILPWLYHPRNRPFGNFKDIIGLVCALCQCIFAAVTYGFARQHADSPIKVTFWPIVFASGLLLSKYLQK